MYLQRPPSRPEATPDPVPLAMRAATLGVIAAVLLGVLLFRLWALQVLHSDQYVAAAAQNSVRTIDMPSPRGEILDRNGSVLVSNTAAIAVQVDAARLPQGGVRSPRSGRSSRCRSRRRAGAEAAGLGARPCPTRTCGTCSPAWRAPTPATR